jgi:hypothetical protein
MININAFIEKHDRRVQRSLEIMPGAVSWFIILFPLWGAFVLPHAVAYTVLAFNVFWFYQSFKAAGFGILGFFKIKKHEKIDWKELYDRADTPKKLKWEDIRHVVIIPNATESAGKLRATLIKLAQQTIGAEKLFVVLAMEERVPDHREKADVLLADFSGRFGRLWATVHPQNIPGEIVGKAANETWGAKRAKEFLLKEGFDLKNLTLTSCDADAQFHPKYFEALTYEFAVNPQRYRRLWQSPIFWYNNLWEVPAFTRIVGVIGNIIQVAEINDPIKLFFNYSTYSTSFKMVDEVDYWDPDIIPEDWHLFLKSFFELNGEVEVDPIFLPTSIDAPQSEGYLGSLINRYEQCKRHAWGATDIPYAVKQFFRHPEIPLITRSLRVLKLVESHTLWSTNWFLLTLGASLPPLFNPVFGQTVLGQNLPRMSRLILTTCLLALATMILLDRSLRPPRPKKVQWWLVPLSYLQWLLMPVATLFMAVLPGLDAQTRLMLGRYLEYRVTEKV